jgi:hypothetical protein
MVLIKVVNEECEQWKLFCLVPSARYCGLVIGIEVFWPCKCLSMNDKVVDMMINRCYVIMDGANNLSKK